jgi:hypothetical protein
MSKFNDAFEEAYTIWNDSGSYEEELYSVCVDVAENYGVNAEKLYNKIIKIEQSMDE